MMWVGGWMMDGWMNGFIPEWKIKEFLKLTFQTNNNNSLTLTVGQTTIYSRDSRIE